MTVEYVPDAGEQFSYVADSTAATRPGTAYGTAFTCATNAKTGAYAQIFGSGAGITIDYDLFDLLICFNNAAQGGQAKDIIADIGIDPSGGTSYTVKIPNLLASASAPFTSTIGQGGIWYRFPLWVRAGSSMAVRGSVNNGAQLSGGRCWVRGYGRPRNQKKVRCGTGVQDYGTVLASSRGTLITPGEGSDGLWTSLGTVSSPVVPWWWQCGFGVNNGTLNSLVYAMSLGLGNATNMITAIGKVMVMTTTSEQLSHPGQRRNAEANIAAGTGVYGKLWCSGTADANTSMIAYGLYG